MNPTPTTYNYNWFGGQTIQPNCTLVVPNGKKQDYINAGWTEDIFKAVVELPSKFDVNEDGKVTIADVTKLVNKILGKE